jgi:hypothetical protein
MSQSDPTFSEFYAGYLAHHRQPVNRALHLAAKLLAIAGLAAAAYERSVLLLLAVPVLAVAPCWLGHLLFEGDRPVSWTQPSASLLGTLGGILGIGIGNLGGIGKRRGRLRGGPDPGHPSGARPPRPPGGRPYYSFAADLRMCGAMLAPLARLAKLGSKGAARASSEPT